MTRATACIIALLITVAAFLPASIIQAIIPAAVPTVNRQGSTGTTFFICTGSFTAGNVVTTDASGNCIDGAGKSVGQFNGNTTAAFLAVSAFVSLSGNGPGGALIEADADTPLPTATTFTALYVYVNPAPGAGASVAFTMRKNGASQALTCTVTDPAFVCHDTTAGHAWSGIAGDLVAIMATPSGSVTGASTISTGIKTLQ
jgi:hypothetical protein